MNFSKKASRFARVAGTNRPAGHGPLGRQACPLSPQHVYAAPASSGLPSLLTQRGPPHQACLHAPKNSDWSQSEEYHTNRGTLWTGQVHAAGEIQKEMQYGCSACSSTIMLNLHDDSVLLAVTEAGRCRLMVQTTEAQCRVQRQECRCKSA